MNYICFVMRVKEIEPDLLKYSLIERVWNAAGKTYDYYESELLYQTEPRESLIEYRTSFDYGVETPTDPQDCVWMVEADNPIDLAHGDLKQIREHYYGLINTKTPDDNVERWFIGEHERIRGAVWADTDPLNVVYTRGFIMVGCEFYPGTPEERKTTIRSMIYDHLKEDTERFVYDEDSELLFFKE